MRSWELVRSQKEGHQSSISHLRVSSRTWLLWPQKRWLHRKYVTCTANTVVTPDCTTNWGQEHVQQCIPQRATMLQEHSISQHREKLKRIARSGAVWELARVGGNGDRSVRVHEGGMHSDGHEQPHFALGAATQTTVELWDIHLCVSCKINICCVQCPIDDRRLVRHKSEKNINTLLGLHCFHRG